MTVGYVLIAVAVVCSVLVIRSFKARLWKGLYTYIKFTKLSLYCGGMTYDYLI